MKRYRVEFRHEQLGTFERLIQASSATDALIYAIHLAARPTIGQLQPVDLEPWLQRCTITLKIEPADVEATS